VKVLDPANVPENKSYPPRLLIALLGGCLSLTGGTAWILGQGRWREIDSQDPRKVFAQEILEGVRAGIPVVPQNGFGLRGIMSMILRRFVHGSGPSSVQSKGL